MADNTEAICHGLGRPARCQLNLCVIRPGNTRCQGLYVSQSYERPFRHPPARLPQALDGHRPSFGQGRAQRVWGRWQRPRLTVALVSFADGEKWTRARAKARQGRPRACLSRSLLTTHATEVAVAHSDPNW